MAKFQFVFLILILAISNGTSEAKERLVMESLQQGGSIPNPLKIGIPIEYTELKQNPSLFLKNNLSLLGFAMDVFNATLARSTLNVQFEIEVFHSHSYNDLVKQVYLKKFDGVVGDISMVAERYDYADFTLPFTETGLTMIVPTKSTSTNTWLFLKPYTQSMWAIIAAINIFNGFAVWLIERKHSKELRGSLFNQIGVLLWLSFTTLFSLQGKKLHSNLSRFIMIVWLFLALIITQTYTANLASFLTVQRLEASNLGNEAKIGYCGCSFVENYLVNVLKYDKKRLRGYGNPDDYVQALNTKEIGAAFLEVPMAKLFLKKYCRGFIQLGPTYEVGGFGFAFSKGSPVVTAMNRALLEVFESGKLLELKDKLDELIQCKDSIIDLEDQNTSLGPNSFRGLFIISVGISIISLIFYSLQVVYCRLLIIKWNSLKEFMVRRRISNVDRISPLQV